MNGNPLNPDPEVGPKHAADLKQAIELAALLGVKRVVAMSGLPAASRGAIAVVGGQPVGQPVPRRARLPVERSRDPFWTDIQARAAAADVKGCIEMHPHNVVFNPGTLERLGDLVYHAAAKDTRINQENRQIFGVLDDRFRRVPPEENPVGIGGRNTLNEWPQDAAWSWISSAACARRRRS